MARHKLPVLDSKALACSAQRITDIVRALGMSQSDFMACMRTTSGQSAQASEFQRWKGPAGVNLWYAHQLMELLESRHWSHPQDADGLHDLVYAGLYGKGTEGEWRAHLEACKPSQGPVAGPVAVAHTPHLEFDVVFDLNPEAIALTDASRRLTRCNPALVSLLGYDAPEALVGRTSRMLYPSDEDFERQAPLYTRRPWDAHPVVQELMLVRRDGSRFPAWTLGVPRFGKDGEMAGLVVFVRDLGARLHTEDLLARAQSTEAVQARQARFLVYSLANALTVISGFSDLLGANLQTVKLRDMLPADVGEKWDDYLDAISISVEHALRETSDFIHPGPRRDPGGQGREDAAAHRRPGHELLLFVDDDPAVRNLIGHQLPARGYRVLLASQGLEALQVLEQHGPDVQLMVTDLAMPSLDGLGLAERVRQQWPHIRILYMSGYPRPEWEGSLFIQKPFRMDEFLLRVRQRLDHEAGEEPGDFMLEPQSLSALISEQLKNIP